MPGSDASSATRASIAYASRHTESQRRTIYFDRRRGRLDAPRLAAHLSEWNSSRRSPTAYAGASWRSRPISRGDGRGAAIVYARRSASRTEMGFFPGRLDQGLCEAYRGLEAARAGGKISRAV